MSHTEGKLSLNKYGNIKTDGGDDFRLNGAILSGKDVALVNTRRLVACWNALMPVPTEWLEQYNRDPNVDSVVDSIITENAKLRIERDGLIEALHMALQWIDSVSSDVRLPAMPGFDRDYVNDLLTKYREES